MLRLLTVVVGMAALGSTASAAIAPLRWWTERDAETGVLREERIPGWTCTESPRLGDATSGFIEGRITLPIDGEWKLVLAIQNSAHPERGTDDYVEIFIDGEKFVSEDAPDGRFLNDEEGKIQRIEIPFSGRGFVYRFEFHSSNANAQLHQWVYGGVAYTGVPLGWWSTATDAECVTHLMCGDPESARLGDCEIGFVEGTITLPEEGVWLLRLRVGPDNDPLRDSSDTTELKINGETIAVVENTGRPRCITHSVTGSSFTYRFDFTSSNAVYHLHTGVFSGEAFLQRDFRYRRGDCNDDGAVNITDASCILNWLFLHAPAPGCLASTNTNGDDIADLTDAVYLLNFLFLRAAPLNPPYPQCGTMPLGPDVCLDCRVVPSSCSAE